MLFNVIAGLVCGAVSGLDFVLATAVARKQVIEATKALPPGMNFKVGTHTFAFTPEQIAALNTSDAGKILADAQALGGAMQRCHDAGFMRHPSLVKK